MDNINRINSLTKQTRAKSVIVEIKRRLVSKPFEASTQAAGLQPADTKDNLAATQTTGGKMDKRAMGAFTT